MNSPGIRLRNLFFEERVQDDCRAPGVLEPAGSVQMVTEW
jgi:hypothetical protein